ncbi:MAG TPA: protein kinase [Holophagaceae bacterium]|nr:protein kinase [Holophagaceae bacterium]
MPLRTALVPLLATLCVAGAELRRPQTPWPALRAFTSHDGLPQNSAMGLAFDREGRLWVATQDGAAVFNGQAWRPLNLPDRQVSNFLRCVALDGEGALWFGRQEGGLARWDGAHWTLLGPESLAGASRVNALGAGAGALWVGTHTRGLLRLQEGRVTGRWLPGTEIRRLAFQGPVLWISTSEGLHRLVAGRLEPVALPQGTTAPAVAWDGEGRTWMASAQGLWRREGRRWVPEPLPPGWTGASTLAFTREARGRDRLWLGSASQGLASREGAGPWDMLDLRAGLPGLTVNRLLVQADGGRARRLWVGLDEGLVRLERGGWSRLTAAHGLPALSTYGLGGDGAGTWWMGTRGGLWEGHLGQVKVAFPGQTVNAVLTRADGSVWAAAGGGLARREGGVWRPVPLPFAPQGFRRLYEIDGDLWTLGGEVGLVRLHGGRWEAWGEAQGLPTKALHSLLRTEEGLWVGTESAGLYLWRQGRWIHHARATGLPNQTVMDLREVRGSDGRRWLLAATESGGLAYAELGAGDPAQLMWRVVAEDTTPALPNNTVYQIQVDGRNRVYAFTNRGVARLAWGNGPDPAGAVETFTTEDGLPSLEFNGGASFRDAQGRIWGGTVAGPVVFDPVGEAPPPPPPPLRFEGVASGARSLAPGAVLSHREARLEVTFAAVDLFKGGALRYRTHLEGVEEEPGPWTVEAHRSYGSLPAGTHVLKVWGRDGLGRELGPLTFPFTVTPAPWRTGWAYGAYLLALLGGAAGVHRLRTRTLRRRTEMLERKVAERTREVASQRDQIAHLMGSLAGAQRDVKAWAHAAADDLARSLGSGPIGVFILEGEDLRPLRNLESTPAPSLLTLTHPPAGLQVVRVQGPSGVLQGALLLPESLGLRSEERDLLEGFASQLGAVLELQKTQVALRAARARGPVAAPEDGELRLCPLCRRAFEAPLARCPEDGEALDDHLRLPYRIQGRYALRGLLGEGGMGLVFEAEDLRLARRVALKVLRPELVTGQARARFLQEAHALAAIHHPGVIGVHDSGEGEGGSVFLVMERLQGQALSTVLKAQGAGHPRQVARLVRQGAAALDAAHGAGLLHRDLKPANLFLATGEAPFRTVLLDFGLAKSLDLASTMTQTGMVIGTPQYMSPEQTMGRDLDARSDTYGFAAVVYEALAGQRLIPHENVGEAFLAIVRGEHPHLRDLRPELGGEVDRLVEKALAPEPEDRPQRLTTWARALAEALEARPDGGPRWDLEGVPGGPEPGPEPPTRALPRP